MGEEWRVFPCLLPHNIYRSGLWYDNPFAWFLRAFSADDMIFLHLLEMLKDGTSIDVQSVSNLSGSDIPIAGDKLQNGISRFWTTFLDHFLVFWTTFLDHLFFPFCPLLHSAKIRWIFWFCKKNRGYYKKVAILFVIFDFCSIWIDSHNSLNFSVLCHFLSDFLASSNLSSYFCINK